MSIEKSYELAREAYSAIGINTDDVLKKLSEVTISLHCWQGDDVTGFENKLGATGGIQTTGNYPGKANTPDELRADLEKALSLLPGKYKVNLHAIYGETDGKVSRERLEPKHFEGWVDWAKKNNLGLDYNGTFFSHKNAEDGFTLSHPDEKIREFWIEHAIGSRKIGEYFGKKLGVPCVTNLWIPDGYKDVPIDRYAPRVRLKNALDKIFAEKIDPKYHLDAVESKLFGIGSESYVVGSNEFYMGYASTHDALLCLDAGHFHPTEVISNKISSAFCYMDEILLHVSRPVRWDSDHVVVLDDELMEIAHELVRNNFIEKTHIGLDFFDASINRIAAWVIGTRNMLKALTIAYLEPTEMLKKAEIEMDYTTRLACLEELKEMPWSAVWNYYCHINNIPATNWLSDVKEYEKTVLKAR